MSDPDLLTRYNYAAFVPAAFEPWLNFAASPPLGVRAPDFCRSARPMGFSVPQGHRQRRPSRVSSASAGTGPNCLARSWSGAVRQPQPSAPGSA